MSSQQYVGIYPTLKTILDSSNRLQASFDSFTDSLKEYKTDAGADGVDFEKLSKLMGDLMTIKQASDKTINNKT